jgi:predicted dinucleotide-binding enzyme
MTSIAVIASGNIGATIEEAWRRAGHDVNYASRSPQPPGTIGIADPIALADLVLLAMPGAAVPELVAAHRDALNGRLVIARRATSAPSACIAPNVYARFAPARDSHARSTRSASRCSPTQR